MGLSNLPLSYCTNVHPGRSLAEVEQGLDEYTAPLRINYDSHNGHPYSSVGRVLIERNLVPREEMSMQRIRDWMAANPDEAAMSEVGPHAFPTFGRSATSFSMLARVINVFPNSFRASSFPAAISR